MICVKCHIEKPVTDFYYKDKKTGRLATQCKRCHAVSVGIVNIGQHQKNKSLLESGKITCSDCKEVKPLSSFTKNKSYHNGYATVCYQCVQNRLRDYRNSHKEKTGVFYLKIFARQNYGVKHSDATPEILEIAKLHLQAKRALRYYLDGLEFKTQNGFAEYVEGKYGVPVYTTVARINNGYSEQQCAIPKHDFRSQYGGRSKGRVKVTNISTGAVQIFTSRQMVIEGLKLSYEAINRSLLTGEIRKPYCNSRNKDTLKIEYYAD